MDLPTAVTPKSTTDPIGATGSDVLTQYSQYLADESSLSGGTANQIWFPTDNNQVASILAQANASSTPVTISGARTGLVGGAVPQSGIILSMERMNKILSLSIDIPSVRVQAGVTIAQLRSALALKNIDHTPSNFRSLLLELGDQQLFYPVNPTEDTAHIGGTVSTNASGSRSLLYGITRPYVLSLTIALPTGHLLSIRRGQYRAEQGSITMNISDRQITIPVPTYHRPLVKNTSGYHSGDELDLIDLFIGAEGTLGVITEIELQLVPRPAQITSALAFFPTEADAIRFIKAARGDANTSVQPATALTPMALEYFDDSSLQVLDSYRLNSTSAGYPAFPASTQAAVLFEQGLEQHHSLEHCFEAWAGLLEHCNSDPDQTWIGFDDDSAEILKQFRHALPEQVNVLIAQHRQECPSVHKIATDMAVAPEQLEKLIELHRNMFTQSQMEHVLYGHIGQNHVHSNLLPRTLEQLETARQLVIELAQEIIAIGGSPLVEHGSGRLKKHLIEAMYGQAGIAQMQALKRSLDPQLILNRGVMFDVD